MMPSPEKSSNPQANKTMYIKIASLRIFSPISALIILFGTLGLISGCGVEPTVREGSEGAYVRLPYVKVLLDDTKSDIIVDGEGTFAVECTAQGENKVYRTSSNIKIANQYGLLYFWLNGAKVPDSFTEIIVIPDRNKGYLKYEGHPYRGLLQITPKGGNLRVINNIHVDDYLKGVVPTEIGGVGEDAFEAIKAQAVAARTYALAHIGQYPNEMYDLKADVSDQVYNGIEVERKLVSKAIDATRGYVLMYRDKMINAYYHSTCGGLTDEIGEVWEKADMPYLKSVFDEQYCTWSKYFQWEESYTADQLKTRIEQYLSSERGRQVDIGDITDAVIMQRTAGGRIADLVVKTTKGDYHFGKDKIRWVFRRSTNPNLILQSARFNVVVSKNPDGKVRTANIVGGGYGHGVGMCQCGAIGRARAGQEFDSILKIYYTGVNLTKLY